MPSQSTLSRRKMKEENPEKYQEYLEKQRLRRLNKKAEEKKKLEEGKLTRAQMEAYRAKMKVKSERAMARYYAKKAANERQTRTSKATPVTPKKYVITPRKEGDKRPRDMTPNEKRVYDAMLRRRQRDARSSQKKTADNMKQRKARAEKKAAKLKERLVEQKKEETRLPKKAYKLTHEFKTKMKALQLSDAQYARSALNIVFPRTPEKRLAIMSEQERHPARVLFSVTNETPDHNIEAELGIEVMDEEVSGDVVECPNATHDLIRDFYLMDSTSRLLPHARYSTKNGAARVMNMTIKHAFDSFKVANPSAKVGLTLFQQKRPKNVRLLTSVPVESCLCIYCTNVRLKIRALNLLLGGSGKLPNEGQLLNFINCPVDSGWNDIKCIDGECDSCKDRLRPLLVFCRDILHISDVSWTRWCRGEMGKMEPLPKTGTVRELLDELNRDVVEPSRGVSFAQHLFTAYWQYSQFKANRRNPSDGEVIMVQDFAENRKAVYAEEIKSAHFGKGQITVHPIVCYYRRGEEIVRHTVLIFSDDIGHDHHAVNCFTLATLDLLKNQATFTRLTMWSDGAASQYKGKGTFADLTLITGLDVQRCFYGSEHGKGEADGETGVLSQILRRSSAEGHSFSRAQDMVTFLGKHHGINLPLKKREYVVINDIPRNRPETEDLVTVAGTRGFHQVQRVGPYEVQARRLACFCTGCTEKRFDSCVNKNVVGQFTLHNLKPNAPKNSLTRSPADQEQTVEAGPSNDLPKAINPSVKIGDYLKIQCEINRLKKTFYAVVIPSPVTSEDFYVSFLKKSAGQAYVFGETSDEGMIYKGPPDNYQWEIIPPVSVRIDNRGHYYFK